MKSFERRSSNFLRKLMTRNRHLLQDIRNLQKTGESHLHTKCLPCYYFKDVQRLLLSSSWLIRLFSRIPEHWSSPSHMLLRSIFHLRGILYPKDHAKANGKCEMGPVKCTCLDHSPWHCLQLLINPNDVLPIKCWPNDGLGPWYRVSSKTPPLPDPSSCQCLGLCSDCSFWKPPEYDSNSLQDSETLGQNRDECDELPGGNCYSNPAMEEMDLKALKVKILEVGSRIQKLPSIFPIPEDALPSPIFLPHRCLHSNRQPYLRNSSHGHSMFSLLPSNRIFHLSHLVPPRLRPQLPCLPGDQKNAVEVSIRVDSTMLHTNYNVHESNLLHLVFS